MASPIFVSLKNDKDSNVLFQDFEKDKMVDTQQAAVESLRYRENQAHALKNFRSYLCGWPEKLGI